MNRSIARRVLVVGVVGTFVLGACGDDDNSADTTTAATEPAAAPETDAPSVETDAPDETDAPAATGAPTDDTPYVEEDDGYGRTTDAPSTDVPATDAPADTVAVTSPPPTGDSALTIADSVFSAATATAGVEFTIANDDDYGHTVTDRNGAFDVQLSGSSSEPLTIDRPGEYEIFCRIHDFMSGTITVV